MRNNPVALPYMEQALALATFDFGMYEVVETICTHARKPSPPAHRRWLIAYLTLRQAEKKEIFDPDSAPAKGYLGTFYTLLGGQQAEGCTLNDTTEEMLCHLRSFLARILCFYIHKA
jgi:hypothetical protein